MIRRLPLFLLAVFLAVVFIPPILAPPAVAQTAEIPPAPPSAFLVGAIAWLVTLAFKKWKPFPNDMLGHVAFWVSQVSAYALAIIHSVQDGLTRAVLGGPAFAQGAATAPPVFTDPQNVQVGAIAFGLVSVFELVLRKLVWRKVVLPLTKR